jgi:hypothetical protein
MEYRDRVEVSIWMDEHLQATLEFMQANIPSTKLLGIAGSLPDVAGLLWGKLLQEPVTAIKLESGKPIKSDREHPSLSAAI